MPLIRVVHRSYFLFALLSALPCLAQVQSGRIVGTITDPNQAVVPSASITVTNNATGASNSVKTNEVGEYTVTPLDPGLYTVEISMNGFQTASVGKVEVQVNQSARADLQMQIGFTATTVLLTTAAPLLNTESGSLNTVVTNTEIVNLPLNGRSFCDLAKFPIAESSLLQFRAEFFKLSNTPTFGIPFTTIDTLSGGVVTATVNNPRQIQFGLKLNF